MEEDHDWRAVVNFQPFGQDRINRTLVVGLILAFLVFVGFLFAQCVMHAEAIVPVPHV